MPWAHWRTALHWAVFLVALTLLGLHVPKLADQFRLATGPLAQLHWPWLAPAVLTSLAGLACYAELHRQLLLVGGVRVRASAVQGITFVQNAISTTVPVVGVAAGLVYAITRLRRYRVEAPLASWAVLLAGALDTVALLVLGLLALALTGWAPPAVVLTAAGVVAALATGFWLLFTHPRSPAQGTLLVPDVVGHRPDRRRTGRAAWIQLLEQTVGSLAVRVAGWRPSGRRWLTLWSLVAVSWLLDFGTLAATAATVVNWVPFPVLVVGFLVVQASIALQLFPGGAGLAEAGLLGVLVAAGLPIGAAAAITLLYRLLSWLLLAVVGWVGCALGYTKAARRDTGTCQPTAPPH